MADVLFDKHGKEIKVGDILAESEVGKVIWCEAGKVVRRPLGMMTEKGLIELRQGLVGQLADNPDSWVSTHLLGNGRCYLSFTTKTEMAIGDLDDYVCKNMEVIMNVDDLPD